MGQRYGADPEQLDALALTMAQSAERLHAIRSEVAAALNRTVWFGVDADDFSWTWYQQVSPSLARVATACDDGAQTLRVNAAQQRGTSGADGGPSQGTALSAGGSGWTGSVPEDSLLGGILFTAGLAGMFVDGMSLLGDLSEGAILGSGLGGLMGLARAVGGSPVTAGIGLGFGIANLVDNFSKDPGSADSLNSAISVGLDVVTIGLLAGSVACPPLAAVAVGVSAASFAFDVVTSFNPELPKQIVEGVGNAASDLAEGVADGVRSLFNW